jgi:ribokinase
VLTLAQEEFDMDEDRKPIVVVGSINIDLVAFAEKIPSVGETVEGTEFQFQPGGKGANQAVAVAKLGYPVKLIGKVGNDVFGTQLLSQLQLYGVDVSSVGIHAGNSGIASIVVSQSGENSIVVIPGANAAVTPDFLNDKQDVISSAGLVLTQLEIPLETVVCLAQICARRDIPLILDPAPAKQLPGDLLKSIAWFTPNETEAAFYAEKASSNEIPASPGIVAERLFDKGVNSLILKLGERGAYIAPDSRHHQMLKSELVKAIDTTAAGDAFNGAFATGLLLWKDPFESARFASAAAAVSVTRAGAQASMASMEEVQRLLEMPTSSK